ncbi:TniB family NTP-binding protein [Afipia sp. TerB]|jgi:hypothetical protein|nr:TniB family NTP-binding protein [Hyphomicrobiales bacterium]
MTGAKSSSEMAPHADDGGLLTPLIAFLDPEDARIARIMEPLTSRYVASERDDIILKQIKEDIVENILKKRNAKLPYSLSNRKAGRGIAIVGPSGAGKSTTLNHIFFNHPAFPGYGRDGKSCSLISVDAPSPCNRAQLGNIILDALLDRGKPSPAEDDDDYTFRRTLPADEAWRQVRYQAWKQKCLVIHVGDMNHVMHQAIPREIKKVTDTLKNLMNDKRWPIHFIFDGTPAMIAFPEGDRQLSRRLTFIPLESVTEAADGNMIAASIRDYAKDAGLKLSVQTGDMLVGRLCRAAAFQMGLAFEILCKAIETALKAHRKTLSITDFAEAYATRTLQPVTLNMFLAPNWRTIDPSWVVEKSEEPNEVKKKNSSHRRTKF